MFIFHSHVLVTEPKKALDYFCNLQDYGSIDHLRKTNKRLLDNFADEVLSTRPSCDQWDHVQPPDEVCSRLAPKLTDTPVQNALQSGRLSQLWQWLQSSGATTFDDIFDSKARMAMEIYPSDNRDTMIQLQLASASYDDIEDYLAAWTSEAAHAKPDGNPETKLWGQLLSRAHHVPLQKTANAHIHAARVARKQNNTSIASSWLHRAAHDPDLRYDCMYEQSKLLLGKPGEHHALQAMEILNSIIVELDSQGRRLQSKACFSAAKLLKAVSTGEHDGNVQALLAKLDPLPLGERSDTKTQAHLQSSVEKAIDSLLQRSIGMGVVECKPWFEYATYHYKQGWRIVDELLHEKSTMPVIQWAREQISAAVNDVSGGSDIPKRVLALLRKYSSSLDTSGVRGDQELINGLLESTGLKNVDEMAPILETLETLQALIVGRFKEAANAYFRYLSLEHEDSQVLSQCYVGDKH